MYDINTIRNPKLRGGHAPGHVRDTFLAAVEAFLDWRPGAPEPMVDFEIDYEPVEIPISRACTLVYHCTDCIPGSYYDNLAEYGAQRQSYSACAQAMLRDIKRRKRNRLPSFAT